MRQDSSPEGAATQAPATPPVPALADYFLLAMRRWWVILTCALLGLGIAWVQGRGRASAYTARVLLQKKEQSSPLSAVSDAGGVPPPEMASQVEIMRSRALLAAVVDSTQLQVDVAPPARRTGLFTAIEVTQGATPADYLLENRGPRMALVTPTGSLLAMASPGEWLKGDGFRVRVAPGASVPKGARLSVRDREAAIESLRAGLRIEQPAGTNLIRVAYTGSDPELVAAVTNWLGVLYRAQSDDRARAAATHKRQFLAGQLASMADSLATAQHAMAGYQEQARILDPRSEGATLANALFQAEGDARTLRFQASVLESVLQSLNGTHAGDEGLRPIVALSSDLVPNGANLYNRLQDLQSQRASLTASRYGYTSKGPRVEVIDSLIRETRGEMRSVLEQSLGLVRARLRDASSRVADLQAKVGGLPARATAFDRLAQGVDNVQKTFDVLADKYYESQVAEATASGDVVILDPARVPLRPDPSHDQRDLVLALLMGALAGFGAATLLERVDTSIRHRGDTERVTGLEVLGMVPRLETGPDGALPPPSSPATARLLDPFRTLRTAVRFTRTERPRVLAVTSQGPGEGKSFIVTYLAATFAQQGARVLVIDGDMRRPVVHERFDVQRTPGLTDVLVGDCTLDEALRQAEAGVSILPAGTTPPDPGNLLESDAFQALLASCRERFDLVILDTPPVLAAPEAVVLCRESQGVLLVVQPFHTRAPALAEAVRKLRQVSAPLLGVVLNRVPTGTGGHGTYYHYYAYHKYYHKGGKAAHGRRKVPFVGGARHA